MTSCFELEAHRPKANAFPMLWKSALGIDKKDVCILSLHVSNSLLDLIDSCLKESKKSK